MESVFDPKGFYELNLSHYDRLNEHDYEQVTANTLSMILEKLAQENLELSKSASARLRRVEMAANYFGECALKYGEWQKCLYISENKLSKRTRLVLGLALFAFCIDYLLNFGISNSHITIFLVIVALFNFEHFYNSFFGAEITDRRHGFLRAAHAQLEILLGKNIANNLLCDLVVGHLKIPELRTASINVLKSHVCFVMLSEDGKRDIIQQSWKAEVFDDGYIVNSWLEDFPAKAMRDDDIKQKQNKVAAWKIEINWTKVVYVTIIIAGLLYLNVITY